MQHIKLKCQMKLLHQTRRDNASYRSVVGLVHGVTCAAAALTIIVARAAEVLAVLLEATRQSPTHLPFSPSIVLSLAHAQINPPALCSASLRKERS